MSTEEKSGLKIVCLPTTSLHHPSKEITEFNDELKQLAHQMGKAMYEFDGVGLAAPQIGKNIKLIVITDGQDGYEIFVNPRITFKSKAESMSEEGCLSVPGVYGFVPRANKIRFSYQDLDGTKHKEKAKGMKAIILQHECHHLEGTLIVDKMVSLTHGQEELERLKN